MRLPCCILLDLIMPHMGGEKTFAELQRIRPDIKVILCSGYEKDQATENFNENELAGFLHKPYPLSRLVSTVQQVLSENAHPKIGS